MEIIQIVGYKNSGKTTLTSKMIEVLTHRGIRVASLKHHGHGGIPVGFEQTDSEQHKRSGALIAGVQGEGVLQLSMDTWDLEKMIAIYKLMETEVLVIEGYKRFAFPKVVLINEVADLVLLDQVDNVKAVITSIPLKETTNHDHVFSSGELDVFYNWLLNRYKM